MLREQAQALCQRTLPQGQYFVSALRAIASACVQTRSSNAPCWRNVSSNIGIVALLWTDIYTQYLPDAAQSVGVKAQQGTRLQWMLQ